MGSLRAAGMLLFAALLQFAVGQTRTDLSEMSICVDPGHGASSDGTVQRKGAFGFSETEKALSVALHLKEFLERSGIDTVILTRTSNFSRLSLTQRASIANNHNVDWFHSIHSDDTNEPERGAVRVLIHNAQTAPDILLAQPTQVTTGQRSDRAAALAALMSEKLASALRLTDLGLTDKQANFTTEESVSLDPLALLKMPATISIAGSHLSPLRNALNLNDDYRRLEAKALALAFMQYFGGTRVPVRTLVGIVSDRSNGKPLGGVRVHTGGETYRTNSYLDTFRSWEVSDSTLSNGFYFFERLPAGIVAVTFAKEGYRDTTVSLAISDTSFTFLDISLSHAPPPVPEELGVSPHTFSLDQNFPNPFNPSTMIRYSLAKPGKVRLEVLNLLGETIAILVDDEKPEGEYHVTWNGVNMNGDVVPSGVYFYKLRQGTSTLTRKMIFVR